MKQKLSLRHKNISVNLEPYSGQWVAFAGVKVIAAEKEFNVLMQRLKKMRQDQDASVMLVPRKDEGPYILMLQ